MNACGQSLHLVEGEDRGLYLVYLPHGGEAALDLPGAPGSSAVQWFNPLEGGALQLGADAAGGDSVALRAPDTEDWLAVVRQTQQ